MTGGRCNNGEAVTVSVVQQMLWYAVPEVEIADSSDVKKSSGRRGETHHVAAYSVLAAQAHDFTLTRLLTRHRCRSTRGYRSPNDARPHRAELGLEAASPSLCLTSPQHALLPLAPNEAAHYAMRATRPVVGEGPRCRKRRRRPSSALVARGPACRCDPSEVHWRTEL
jgi:hypothetical protein